MGRLIQNSTTLDKQFQYEMLGEVTQLKMRVLEGLPTFLQISGFMARIADIASKRKADKKGKL
jgi:hypothetical protein